MYVATFFIQQHVLNKIENIETGKLITLITVLCI